MHNLHILVMIVGVSGAAFTVAMYYWAQGRLISKSATFALGFGTLLGLVAVGATYSNYFVFVALFSGYIAYFVHLKNNVEFNLQTESTMAALFMGAVIGFSGLFGCMVCHT